jgi:hypothetical protein
MSCPMSGMNNVSDDSPTIPNYHAAKCCYSCIHGGVDIRFGCGYQCSKYAERVEETNICDAYEELV